MNHDVVAEFIHNTQARVLALPVFSDGHERVEHLIRGLREQQLIQAVVVGGPHVEAVGSAFLKGVEGVFCCRESSGAQVYRTFSRAIESVAGIHSTLRSGVIDGEPLGLGPIRYELLEQLAPGTAALLRPVIISSLGCDHKCLFCAEGCREGGVMFRARDAIQDEMDWIASRTEFPYVMIADDNALASEDHTRLLLQVISKGLALRSDLQFFVLARPDDVVAKQSILRSLSAHNVVRIQLGIESGCQKMRQRYGKRLTTEIIRDAVRSLYQSGIPFVVGTFILGGPYEDEFSLAQTESLIHELLDAAPGVFEPAFSFLRPYPGTRIATSFKDGLKSIPGIRVGNTIEDRPLMETPALNEQQLIENRDALMSSVREHMLALADRLGTEFWLKKHACEQRCRFESLWTAYFTEAPNCSSFLRLMSGRELVNIHALSGSDLKGYRPRCTVEIPVAACFRGMSLPFGRGKIAQISAETARVLSLCNGERTLQQVINDFNLKYPSHAKTNANMHWDSLKELTEGFLLIWDSP